jgi:predicted ArsR family transcriptional regulator
MDLLPLPDDDVLATPTRARLFAALAGLRRPASTAELARLIGRHPNTTRVQLQRLQAAGLIDRRKVPQTLGRPRHAWAVRPDARPGGSAPRAHADLGRWLARAMRHQQPLDQVEAAGREIGRDLAPAGGAADGRQAMHDVLTAMGFAPRDETSEAGGWRHVLANCPYREAVAENAAVVCTLHRGITEGLLDQLDPTRRLTAFVAKDPFTAGCLIDVGAA